MEDTLEVAEPRQQDNVLEQSLWNAAASAQSHAEFSAVARAALCQHGAPYWVPCRRGGVNSGGSLASCPRLSVRGREL